MLHAQGLDLKDRYVKQSMQRYYTYLDSMLTQVMFAFPPQYLLTTDNERKQTLNPNEINTCTAAPKTSGVTLRVSRPVTPRLSVETIPMGHLFQTANGAIYLRTVDSYVALTGISQHFVTRRDGPFFPPLNVVADLGKLNVVVE